MTKSTTEVPGKLFYKIGEVCEITDTQPYVLRFWESEFPQLAPKKNRSGQRVYKKKDIDTVLRIKRLLYEEEYTIAGARKKLDEDSRAHKGTGPVEVESPPSEREIAHEHPVDVLTARSSRRESGRAGREGRRTDEQRLLEALGELKGSLEAVLAMLRRD